MLLVFLLLSAQAVLADPVLSPEHKRLLERIAELKKKTESPYAAMLNAAKNYASVKAKEKEADATRQRRRGSRWDSAGISGGLNRGRSSPQGGNDLESESASISASVSIALTTWFAEQGIRITEDIQRSAIKALQIQLAIETASAHFSHSRASNQYYLQGMIELGLGHLKFCSDAGAIPLSAENKALLDLQLAALRLKMEATEAQVSMAQSALKRLTGKPYPDTVGLYKQLIALMRSERRAEACNSDDKGKVDARFDPIPWDKLDSFFPIPSGVDEAARIARSSPALVMADLGTAMARNQWFLTMAGMAPVLSFSFDRTRSESSMGGASSTTTADSYRVSLGFQIRAGIPYHLRSARLLEEAARFNYRATELQILNSLENSYDGLRTAKVSAQLVEQSLRHTTIPALNGVGRLSDENLKAVLGLFEAAIAQVDLLVGGLNGYVMQRAGILAQTGSLLPELERLQRALPQRPEAPRP